MEEQDAASTPDSLPRAASADYQSDSAEPAAESPGYQSDSTEPASLDEVPEPGPLEEDERIDPYRAFAEAAAKEQERKKSQRDPAIWLPSEDEFDEETYKSPDEETRFSRDGLQRGNPQVSVRLRPRDFERLRRAADLYGVRPTTFARMMVIRGIGAILEAELRRKGEFLRNP